MIQVPQMVMIGAAGRHIGKTELACQIISRFCAQQRIAAVKVTPVKQKHVSLPKKEDGRCLYSSPEGRFWIWEDQNPNSGTDTSRLLKAGAHNAYWLCFLDDRYEAGLQKLLEIIGPDRPIVCESNSLRTVVEPGLFLLVKHKNSEQFKPSAIRIKELADQVVVSDGRIFDIDLGDFGIEKNSWTFRLPATAVVLAGGKSSRMGQDKGLLPIAGKPMIVRTVQLLRPWFKQLIISSSDTEKYGFLDIPVVPDRVAGQGPIQGILSSLAVSQYERLFVIACDIPEFDLGLVKAMLRRVGNHDAVVPSTSAEYIEPVFAVYTQRFLTKANGLFEKGERKIRNILEDCDVLYFQLTDHNWLKDINSPEDYRSVEELIS